MDNIFSVVIAASDADCLAVTLNVLSMHEKYIKEVIVIEDSVNPSDQEILRLANTYGAKHVFVPGTKINRFDVRQKIARTVGQGLSSGEITLFLDQDSFPCLWYFERLMEIHDAEDSVVFSSPRIYLSEDVFTTKRELNRILSLWWEKMGSHGTKIHESFMFDSGGGAFGGLCSNGCSVRTRHIPKIGEWENLFGFGEEDLYWGYKAVHRAGLKLMTTSGPEGLFVLHINHARPYFRFAMPIINRLFLYEKDPAFRAAVEEQYDKNPILEKTDWCFLGIHQVKREGLESLDGFECFPSIPPSLHKYLKSSAPISI